MNTGRICLIVGCADVAALVILLARWISGNTDDKTRTDKYMRVAGVLLWVLVGIEAAAVFVIGGVV